MRQSDAQRIERVKKMIKILRTSTSHMEKPASDKIIARYGRDPYLILIACLLSLRTRDTTSFPAACRLFAKAKTPKKMRELSEKTIEKLIYPVGFYRNKAKTIRHVSKQLLDRFGGKVPKTKAALRSIKGIGLKTANLVLGEAFEIPAICVDTHVHRISNRHGLVKTKRPEETEQALQNIVPKKNWIEFGKLLVMWGQNICLPRKCPGCVLNDV